MYSSSAPGFGEIRQYLDHIPVIETHEHYAKYQEAGDALSFILGNYYESDFQSAGGEAGFPGGEAYGGLSSEEKYERFMRVFRRSDKTAYARSMMEGLRLCWGVGGIDTYGDFLALEEKLKGRGPSVYDEMMEKLGIRAKVVDMWDLMSYVEGVAKGSKYCRFAFSLPFFHDVHCKGDLQRLRKYLGRPVTTLDDYLESFDNYLQKCVDFGVVCFKDQTAYRRTLAYGNPDRAEAEKVFNDMVFNPRDVFGDDRVRALDDWLFHYALRRAAKYGLPVQIHTGHMAGIRNEIAKTNACHLIPTIELHEDVRFDLFHGNWPYMDEYLFMGKNYPNVWLNLCWVQAIDPVYCVELMKRAVMTVPHSKVFAFGGDTGMVEWAAGYLALAKDNVACALSELAESGWISIDEAKRIGLDWFFNNPNEFYGLGLKE
ncbi:MAG: amidohydrolase [Firmicutes bacterium]|nr:amidohydrolase [Bacillota bacterium]